MARLRTCLAALAANPHPALSIVRSGGLGDTILLSPTLGLLYAVLPGVQITLVASQWAEALVPLLPFPLTTRRFDAADLAPLFAGPAPDRLGIFGDAVIVYTEDARSAFVQNAERLCTGPVVVQPATQIASVHAALHYARAIADLDMEELFTIRLTVPRQLREAARRDLRDAFGTDEGLVAVHVGSGGKRKCWPAERWITLLEALARPIVLVEGPADAAISQAVRAGLPPSVRVRSIIKRSVAEVAAYIEAARFYVGNDSGMSHLAAALGVPTAVIFGPTDPAIWRPPNAIVVAEHDQAWPSVEQGLLATRALDK